MAVMPLTLEYSTHMSVHVCPCGFRLYWVWNRPKKTLSIPSPNFVYSHSIVKQHWKCPWQSVRGASTFMPSISIQLEGHSPVMIFLELLSLFVTLMDVLKHNFLVAYKLVTKWITRHFIIFAYPFQLTFNSLHNIDRINLHLCLL